MSGQTLTLTSKVKNHMTGFNLLDYMCKRFPYKTQSGWLDAIIEGRVVLNGETTTPTQALQLNDSVSYTSERNEPTVATDIETIYEDEYLLVVNKPAPLPVHAYGIFIKNTLIHILRERTGNPDLSLGHRLDRDTTGIMVLAKNRSVTAKLMAKFEEAHSETSVEKWYLAIARGEVDFNEKLIHGWMGAKSDSQIRMRQQLLDKKTDGYKESATRFLLKDHLKGYSLLECQLLSGRSNQIRVHLEAAGYPLAGDKLYGRTDTEFLTYLDQFKKNGDMDGIDNDHPRQLLHSWKLSLNHPITNERVQWEAPMPKDMQEFVGKNK